MNYYLETNSLRGLNKELNSLSSDCYTSALSIFELIAEITKNEKEFNIRKSVIQNVLNSNIQINWDSHKTIKAKCLPQITFKDAETEGLKELTYDLDDVKENSDGNSNFKSIRNKVNDRNRHGTNVHS